jgi:hypothetical protein
VEGSENHVQLQKNMAGSRRGLLQGSILAFDIDIRKILGCGISFSDEIVMDIFRRSSRIPRQHFKQAMSTNFSFLRLKLTPTPDRWVCRCW